MDAQHGSREEKSDHLGMENCCPPDCTPESQHRQAYCDGPIWHSGGLDGGMALALPHVIAVMPIFKVENPIDIASSGFDPQKDKPVSFDVVVRGGQKPFRVYCADGVEAANLRRHLIAGLKEALCLMEGDY